MGRRRSTSTEEAYPESDPESEPKRGSKWTTEGKEAVEEELDEERAGKGESSSGKPQSYASSSSTSSAGAKVAWKRSMSVAVGVWTEGASREEEKSVKVEAPREWVR